MSNEDKAIEGDEFIQKHLSIIKEKTLESHIQLKLEHLHRPPLSSSVKYFLETGTINGNFLLALKSLFDNIPKILWATSTVQGMDSLNKEQQDHYYTRIAWDQTIIERDELKIRLSANPDFLSVLEENFKAAKSLTDEDKIRPAQELLIETYKDLISIYKSKYLSSSKEGELREALGKVIDFAKSEKERCATEYDLSDSTIQGILAVENMTLGIIIDKISEALKSDPADESEEQAGDKDEEKLWIAMLSTIADRMLEWKKNNVSSDIASLLIDLRKHYSIRKNTTP